METVLLITVVFAYIVGLAVLARLARGPQGVQLCRQNHPGRREAVSSVAPTHPRSG
jgi:hypothetical protein